MELNINKEISPYIGLSSYTEELSSSFFGRKEETSILIKRINKNIVTVLYGKAGIGKSSLIKAGLIPSLKKEYMFPIYIKVNYKNKRLSPIEQIKSKIVNRLKKVDESVPEFNNKTLWEYFHEIKLMDGLLKPVIIFDQFEDIFSLDKKHQKEVNEIILEISNLIENQIPVSVSGKYEKGSIPFDVRNQNYRIILSIRESSLYLLEDLNSFIPSAKKNRFKLLELNRQAAIDVVYNSAKEIISLEVAESIVDKILEKSIPDFLKHSGDKELIESFLIEPFILSLVCYEINEIRINEGLKEISVELLEKIKISKIIKEFYETSTSDLPKSTREIIENILLTFDGYRKLENKSELMLKEDVSEIEINRLINRRIIRTEIWNGVEHIEIIHDILIPIIKEIRDIRVEEERKAKREDELRDIRRQEEQKRIAQKRKMLIEAEKEKQRHKQRFKLIIVFTSLSVIVAFVLAVSWFYADKQSIIAKEAAKEASSNYIAADGLLIADKNPTKGFLLAQSAYRQSPSNKMSIRAIIKCFYEGNFFSNFFESKAVSLLSHYNPRNDHVIISVDDSIFIYDNDKVFIRKFGGYGKISWFEVSSDGKYIIAASSREARLYSITGEELQVFTGHKKMIRYVCFSSDNKKIATASNDNSVIIWDLAGNNLLTLKGSTSDISTVDFSPNGKLIVTGSKNRLLTIWNSKGSIVSKVELEASIEMAKFSPDGKYIITSTSGPSLNIHQSDGKKLFTRNLISKISYINFSKMGKYFISAGFDGVATLWDLSLFKYKEFKGHEAPVLSADFSSDMKYLITSSLDNSVKKWKLQNIEPYTLIKTTNTLFFVDVNSKDQILSAIDDTIIIWNKKGKLIKKFAHGERVYSAKFSHNEKMIVSAGNDKLAKVWDLNGKLITVLEGHDNDVLNAKFSTDDKNILTASTDGKAILWNLKGEILDTFINESGLPILDVAFSPNKKYIAFSTQEDYVILKDLENNTSVSFTAHDGGINSISFSPSGDKLLTCGLDKTAKIWNLNGKASKILKGHSERLNSAEFSPDGKYIITSSDDRTCKYWTIGGDELFTFKLHSDIVNSAVFSNNGRFIISSSSDNTLKKWPISINEIFKFIDKNKIYGDIWQLDNETKDKYNYIF